MGALARGWPNAKLVIDRGVRIPREQFFVMGQLYTAERVVPYALRWGIPFWHVDNGFWWPGRGRASGYYRFTYCRPDPIMLRDPDIDRLPIEFAPWRKGGRNVVLALPGPTFGKLYGINCQSWIEEAEARIRAVTDRPIIVRLKDLTSSLAPVLEDAWCLVTHSSNVAIDAVVAGVPVFVAPTSPAAPVGRTDLDIENPITPEREAWWASLMCQQFTLPEMEDGTTFRYLSQVRAQIEHDRSSLTSV